MDPFGRSLYGMLTGLNQLIKYKLAATDGEIGQLAEIYFDEQTWKTRYLVVQTGFWLFDTKVLIAPQAIREIDHQANALVVNLTLEQVRSAPGFETDKPVSRQYEEQLGAHYGWMPNLGATANSGELLFPTSLLDPAQFEQPGFQPIPETGPENHLRSSDEVTGYKIRAQDGEFGMVSDFIIPTEDWSIRYLVIATHRWIPGKHVLIAPEWIEKFSWSQEQVFVRLPSSAIKGAPVFDPDAPLSRSYEQRLHEHFRESIGGPGRK